MIMKQSIALSPRNFVELVNSTGNIYETTVIIAKRAKKNALKTKEELDARLVEFVSHTDNLEEVIEDKKRIEISKSYEKQPKPVSMAIEELLDGKIMVRYPDEVVSQQ